MIIGITGGTGCGKTTLLKEIARRGGLILDCDEIYHELLLSDEEMLAAIGARFPGTVDGGLLQRKKLGAIVFADEAALLDLNRITHGAVKREVERRLAAKPALAAIDAIGLFEGNLAELCDVTVAVSAPTEDRIRRLMKRDGISRPYAEARIAAQRPGEYYAQICDVTLENSGEIEDFRTKCAEFLDEIS